MNQYNSILLSTAYFPPIRYFTFFIGGKDTIIENNENYLKQTYRNRCHIYSPNGIQVLSVPVERGSFHKVAIADLKIDYTRSWKQNHLRALKTAYNSSAFYEFYIDEIELCIQKDHSLLMDLNMDILNTLMSILDLDNRITKSISYVKDDPDLQDLRNRMNPKKEDEEFINSIPEYFQVFADKSAFLPNLSILDLIFNMGPESYSYLKNCIKK